MKWMNQTKPIAFDLTTLALRLAGGLLLLHGIPKLLNFGERINSFGDPLGIGSTASLALCVFAEFFCTALVVLGLFTRYALVPIIINMAVIVFIVHGAEPLKERELPIIFLLIFTALFFSGPGKYSVDGLRGH